MINTIEINIGNKEYIIIPEKNILYNNQKEYNITNDQIDKIISIIITWKYEYGISNIIDEEEFLIKVIDNNNEKTTYHGKGIFPNNYQELKNILSEVEYE